MRFWQKQKPDLTDGILNELSFVDGILNKLSFVDSTLVYYRECYFPMNPHVLPLVGLSDNIA